MTADEETEETEETTMTRVLIIGAGGRIARHVIEMLAATDDVELTLLARSAAKIESAPPGARIVEGDVTDRPTVESALADVDVVYANLTGDMGPMTRSLVDAMSAAGVSRLIHVLALGIYDEVPGAFGEWNTAQIGPYLGPFREAADIVEAGDLDYTLLRPAWLTEEDEVTYALTGRDEPFGGTEVSRKAVAALIVEIIADPRLHSRTNLGVHRPGSDGDRPSFM